MKKITDSELYWAIEGIWYEAIAWWKDGHTRTAWLLAWQDGNVSDPAKAPRFFSHDEQSISSHNDYRLWVLLGYVSDAILAVMVLATILAVLI